MNIKQSIALLLISLGVSFSAYSEPAYYVDFVRYGPDVTAVDCISPGQIVAIESLNGCKYELYGYWERDASSAYWSASKIISSPQGEVMFYGTRYMTCPDGTLHNPLSGSCEAECPPDSQLNPETGECEETPFCDRDSTNEQLFAAEQACAADGGIFSFECHSGDQIGFPEGLSTKCTQPNECVMGYPNWPDCLGDIDPTDPVTPPGGDFGGGSPGTSNPDTPSFDKDEPDSVTPSDTTDTAVLEGIQNLNRDMNQGLSGINNDLNIGFNDVNNQLTQLNATNNAIGQSITDQMNQDYQIHLANKELSLQQTGAIMNGTSSIVGAIGKNSSDIQGSIASQTKAQLEALNELNHTIAENAPCDPNVDGRSCEGQHGLDTSTVGAITKQIDDSVNSSYKAVTDELTEATQSLIDTPLTGEVEHAISSSISDLLGLLPSPGQCVPFSLPSPFGGEVSFSCDFSVQFKALFSFLMYFFTAMTLIDILLTGITPRIQTTQNHSDYVT
ncbi:hypothetical protein AKJ18_13505 [Vibrio xuii]|nr:hypothetical protein AKJ18_13505 [Vibrio xuii]